MTYEAATQLGIDLIAPAVTIFLVWYSFRPWRQSHVGRAIWLHSFGSMLLFDMVSLEQHGIIPEEYPGRQPFMLVLVVLWIVGWWYMVFSLWLTRGDPQSD